MVLVNNIKKAKTILLILILFILFIGNSYADTPDYRQNSGYNNIAYDLSAKFYTGANASYSIFTDKKISVNGKDINIDSHPLGLGVFAGYKFNDYVALEANFQRFGELKNGNKYETTIYNLSADLLLSYPFITKYYYTLSIFGKAGYGINFTSYKYDVGNNRKSGSLDKGAYNFGAGLNADLRENISLRLGYTYYQTHYPLLGYGSKHAGNVFTLALYYNFS